MKKILFAMIFSMNMFVGLVQASEVKDQKEAYICEKANNGSLVCEKQMIEVKNTVVSEKTQALIKEEGSWSGAFIAICVIAVIFVIMGMGMGSDSTRLRIKKMEANNKTLEKEVKKMDFGKAALRIEFENDRFVIKALKPQRISPEGMWSTLRDIKEGEVSVSPAAMKVLKRTPERRGLMAIEFGLAGDILFLSRANVLTNIPVEDVSVSNENLENLMKLIVVE